MSPENFFTLVGVGAAIFPAGFLYIITMLSLKKFMHHVINGVRDLGMYHFDNVKTGLYLLQITNGNKQTTKKIMIH